MKNSFKKFVFIMLAFAFLFVNSVSAFAAEFTTVEAVQSSISTQSNSFPYSSLANSLNTTTSWKTIATSNTGFSCNVFIRGEMFLLNISFFYIFSHVLCLLIDNYFNISSTQEVYQFSIQYQSISI